MNQPQIIQGGMGVAISDWRLANAVSREGQLGVVSGTGIGLVLLGRLNDGDPEGHVRRALAHFPYQEPVQKILDANFKPNGRAPGEPYKRPPMWTLRPSRELNVLTVIANFVEIWLAKEGHSSPVGINLLEKVQLPTMASLYGAMLAGVDVVIMGAGVPMQIPGILDQLATHGAVSYRLDVLGMSPDDDIRLHFDPNDLFPGIAEKVGALTRPLFYPIISSNVLALALLKRASGKIDGFVIETPIAGGHNAPPRGQAPLNAQGEPVYGDKDVVDLAKMRALGLPFWIGGGYGTPEKLQEALAAGAAGIQVGTAFAYCEESGMEASLKHTLVERVVCAETDPSISLRVHTSPLVSPTGFPFKVVPVPGSLSEPEVYEERDRICDIGYLRQAYRTEDGGIGFRCAAEPVEQYVKKGGDAADTEGRVCLCNNLGATAGFPQVRKDGFIEPPIVTSGDDFAFLKRYVPDGSKTYTARDVIRYLLGEKV